MSESRGGRFTVEVMTRTMRTIADRLGIPTGDAQLLRLTNNAVFALPAAGLVIRITRAHQLLNRAHKLTALAAWFAEVNAPTIRLAPDIDQPILLDGLAATIWSYLPPVPPDPTVNDLGQVLRTLHRLGAPPIPLPAWDPIGDARRRLTDAEGLRVQDRELLLAWCDELAPQIAQLRDTSPRDLVHGDAHVGNLLRESTGRVVLCDFDATCVGPWQVDLVAVAVGEARFDRPGTHHRFAASYGYDVATDAHWPLLREARELKMIVAAVPLLESAPGVADEFALRLRSVMTGDHHARWTPFADLSR